MNNLWDAFEHTVREVPERLAIISDSGRFSFSSLAARSTDFRLAYLGAGVKPGDRVLLLMENCFDMAAALVATWGQEAIPALLDGKARKQQLIHAVEKVTPRVLVHKQETPLGIEGRAAVRILNVQQITAAPNSALLPPPSTLPTDPASIVFTSGSTGPAKGVIQSHLNLYDGCRTVYGYLGLRGSDVLLCPVPWSFDYGLGQLLTTLLCGLTHIIPAGNDPFRVCASIEEERPTVLAGIPSLFAYLMGGMSPICSTDISSIRLLTSTGGRVQKNILSLMVDTFDQSNIVLNYGLTETYRSCYLPPHLVRTHADSIGFPIPGVGIEILREDGTPAHPGEEGEIVHRGRFVCLGYWNDEESSARSLRRDPRVPCDVRDGINALYTGDIGCMDEAGFFHFIGRRDRLIKSMGVRVSPGEVEHLLCDSGLLAETAVFGLEHWLTGQEVWAAVVPNQPVAFAIRELEKFARDTMSQYMQPRRYLVLDAMPKTSSGKVDYISLEASARSSI